MQLAAVKLKAGALVTNSEIYQDAIKTFGERNQIIKAIEELNELSTALARYLNNIGDFENIAEELADVDVMCEQLCMMFKNRAEVLKVKQAKVTRLRRTVAAEKAKRTGVI